jgi:uncharacterized protein YegP (UPF0339 family)
VGEVNDVSFVINRSRNGQFYFEILAGNNRTLATSETYWNKHDCVSAANLVKGNAAGARVVDNT